MLDQAASQKKKKRKTLKGQSTGFWHVQRGLKYVPALKNDRANFDDYGIFYLDTFLESNAYENISSNFRLLGKQCFLWSWVCDMMVQ